MKKGHKLFLSLMIIVCIIGYAPFHIHADSYELVNADYDDVIEGVYYTQGTSGYNRTITWVFNQPVYGKFNVDITWKPSSNSNNTNVDSRTIYINDTSASYTMSSDDSDIVIQSINIGYDELFIYSSTEMNTWNFPIESYSCFMSLYARGFEMVGIDQYNQFYFPMFKLAKNTNKIAYNSNVPSNRVVQLILWVDRAINYNNFSNWFTISNANITLTSVTNLTLTPYGRIIKIIFTNNTSSNQSFNLTYVGTQDTKVMPIFGIEYVSDTYNVTTDFALNFGLTNDLLNNLNIIAQGSSASQQSESDLDAAQSQMDSTITNVDTYEQQFTSDFTSAMQNVPSTITWSSQFLTSANWVKTQFDNLTDNNVFGSVLTFSLILGISTLIIGKVFK